VLNSPDAELVRLESACATLADQATATFSDPNQVRVTTDAVFSVMTRVLAAADVLARTTSTPLERRTAEQAAQVELAATGRRVRAMIQRQARFTYFLGALAGTVLALALCALLGVVIARNWWTVVSTPAVVAASTFGALGALTSVFQRMSTGRLLLDFNVGTGQLVLLGSLRPFVGAVLGTVLQFALVGGVLSGGPTRTEAGTFGFFALVGFAAGFSERFATDMIERAGRVLEGTIPTATPPTTATPGRGSKHATTAATVTEDDDDPPP
jgi:hypothetical protein